MKKVVIIVAGGSGTRMESEVPKQFMLLNGLPVIMHTIHKFYAYDSSIEIRIVLPESEIETWNTLCINHNFAIPCQVFPGGETRFHSVKNGLHNLSTNALTGIHDGVRPLVSNGTITRCYDLAETNGSAVPVMPVPESIRKVEGEDSVSEERSLYRIVQTPQIFSSEILLDAYNLPFEDSFTDDASVVEKAGYKIYLTEGNEDNIKITTRKDLLIAELLDKNMKK